MGRPSSSSKGSILESMLEISVAEHGDERVDDDTDRPRVDDIVVALGSVRLHNDCTLGPRSGTAYFLVRDTEACRPLISEKCPSRLGCE